MQLPNAEAGCIANHCVPGKVPTGVFVGLLVVRLVYECPLKSKLCSVLFRKAGSCQIAQVR